MSKYLDLKEPAAANGSSGDFHVAAASVLKEIERRQVRSPRIRLPLFLYGYTEKEKPFFADAWTTDVSIYGASIVTGAMLQPGQDLIATNKASEATAVCRVACVVAGPEGKAEATIEFLDPMPEFWRQAGPHADAGTSSADLVATQNIHS
jgi:hypothetical protein